ncbi:MAG: type II toxin-antitoxin system prevent-host-death family antitoxin [bacterium]|nr:type II toxin-antitoxin system prevent-host-death family antitoxin [bacterium]
MTIVNVHQAKSQLSKLIEQAERGEDVVIARAGKPAVRLVAYSEPRVPRQAGLWRNQVTVAEDFDVLPDDLLEALEGRDP